VRLGIACEWSGIYHEKVSVFKHRVELRSRYDEVQYAARFFNSAIVFIVI
jgi:hypothetical protein